jgi:hypothetical protein
MNPELDAYPKPLTQPAHTAEPVPHIPRLRHQHQLQLCRRHQQGPAVRSPCGCQPDWRPADGPRPCQVSAHTLAHTHTHTVALCPSQHSYSLKHSRNDYLFLTCSHSLCLALTPAPSPSLSHSLPCSCRHGMPLAYTLTMLSWAMLKFPNTLAGSDAGIRKPTRCVRYYMKGQAHMLVFVTRHFTLEFLNPLNPLPFAPPALLDTLRSGADYLMRCDLNPGSLTAPMFVAQVGDAGGSVLFNNAGLIKLFSKFSRCACVCVDASPWTWSPCATELRPVYQILKLTPCPPTFCAHSSLRGA